MKRRKVWATLPEIDYEGPATEIELVSPAEKAARGLFEALCDYGDGITVAAYRALHRTVEFLDLEWTDPCGDVIPPPFSEEFIEWISDGTLVLDPYGDVRPADEQAQGWLAQARITVSVEP